MAPAGHFGPAVIGEEQHEEEQRIVEEEQRLKFGDRVVGGSNMEAEPPEVSASPEQSGEDVPEGYTIEMSGAYAEVTAPDGEQVTHEADTDNGKYHGKEAAKEAAWEHQRRQEIEASEGEGEGAEAESSPAPEAEGWETEEAIQDATIEEAERALEANPALVDQFMRAELTRPDGVRPEVVDAMEDAELGRDEPRESVLETLDSMRAELETEE